MAKQHDTMLRIIGPVPVHLLTEAAAVGIRDKSLNPAIVTGIVRSLANKIRTLEAEAENGRDD